MVNVLFFGRLGDFAAHAPTSIEASTPAQIRELLAADFPALAKELHQPQVLVSVNQLIVGWDQILAQGAEVAFLPPVTGG
jgi:molybdopterin synthase sulfur carrier subunit